MSIECFILMGESKLSPLPTEVMEAVQAIEVLESDSDDSGFQITFAAGRGTSLTGMDYPLLKCTQMQPFNRVQIIIRMQAKKDKIMDGFITHIELQPDVVSGTAVLTVTGKDLSIKMDMTEKRSQHELQADHTVVANILQQYKEYDLKLEVVAPPVIKTDQTVMQRSTDLEIIRALAKRWNYTFYIISGPSLTENTAYWGPQKRVGLLQKALSVGMGPNSNVAHIHFKHDMLAASTYSAKILDMQTDQIASVATKNSLQIPLSKSVLATRKVRTSLLTDLAGNNFVKVAAIAQAQTNAAAMKTLQVEGELDILRYGSILRARNLVGLRGAGTSYDGVYFVKQVNHTLKLGSYRQQFVLARDGTGSTVPVVMP